MKRFSELCNCINDQCEPVTSGASVYVGLEHIDSGTFFLARHGRPVEVQSAKSHFQRGDILYGKLRPYLDKAVIAPVNGICSTDILVLRPKPDVCSVYLLSLIHSIEFLTHASQTTNGVNHPRTSWSGLSGFSWNVPPKPEQEKIAAVLWKIQRAIEAEEKLIGTTRELNQSAMRQFFSHGLRAERAKETEVGTITESWVETSLGELCSKEPSKIQTGPFGSQLHASEYQPVGFPVVNPTHLDGNRINHQAVPRVSPNTAARLERHKLEGGDILFARRGEIGRHGLVGKAEEGWLCGTGCFLVRVRDERIDNAFLSRFFSTKGVVTWLNAHAAGAIMPNLNNVVLGKLPIFYPNDLAEQREIAGILQTIDRKISAHERKRATLQELFQTLLNQLMIRQIRVHELNIDVSEIQQ